MFLARFGNNNPTFGRWALCPRKCNQVLCGIQCQVEHCSKHCYFPDPGLYRFGGGFCRPRGPLTWAHCCAGVPVVIPFDKLYNPDADFFSASGKSLMKEFDSESVLWEHWGPDCKLMSRARGKPIQLSSGRWISGPKAVRSERYPLGFPMVTCTYTGTCAKE